MNDPITDFLHRLILASLFSAAIAAGAYRLRALTAGGAASAFVVGALIFASGGWPAAGVLLVFFVTSSALSRLRNGRNRRTTSATNTLARTGAQVWANGGAAVLCLLAPLLLNTVHAERSWQVLYLGAIAAANADTWATEVGGAIGGKPWDLRTFRRVTPGVSGAVTIAGLLAALCGAAVVAATGARWVGLHDSAAAGLGGFCGSLADSIAGATVQGQWSTTSSATGFTEVPQHNTKPVRGIAFVENNTVNVICTVGGVLATELLIRSRF